MKLTEIGTAGDAASVLVICEACEAKASMAQAFDDEKFGKKGCICACRGREPHLRRFVAGCEAPIKTILLGASNSWFLSTLHAKCAVADDTLALISSANLTGHALQLNIEAGVLLRGEAAARAWLPCCAINCKTASSCL